MAGSTPFFLRAPAARGDVRPNADHWVFGDRRPVRCRPIGSVTMRGSGGCTLPCCGDGERPHYDTVSGYIGGSGKSDAPAQCRDPLVEPASLATSSIRASCDIVHTALVK